MTAGDLLRGTLRLLWHTGRLPAYVFLVILEPVVRFVLGALALLGVLTALFFKFYGVALSVRPHARRVGGARIDPGRLLQAATLVRQMKGPLAGRAGG
jgi:hypothetical protein